MMTSNLTLTNFGFVAILLSLSIKLYQLIEFKFLQNYNWNIQGVSTKHLSRCLIPRSRIRKAGDGKITCPHLKVEFVR